MSLALPVLVLLSLAAAAAETAPVDRLVAQLGAANWEEREAASEKLLNLGSQAIPALERALNSPDPEVRFRARGLIDRLRWTAPGGLSDRVRAVIQHYESLPEHERAALLNDVVRELREGAAPVLLQALRTDRNPVVRSVALRHLVSLDRGAAEAELRALAREPAMAAWASASLGDLLAARGQTDEAIAAYTAARKGGARDERMTEALAQLYAGKGQWGKARDLYAELVAGDPENGSHRLQLGRCYHMLGDHAAAEAAWREVIRTKGGDPNAYIWLSGAYTGIGERDKALAALREGCERHPDAFELLRHLASALAERGNFDEAVTFYERAQQAAQSDFQRRMLHMELTAKLRRAGQLDAYLERQERDLTRLDAEIGALLRTVAEAHLAAGDRAAARKSLQKLATLYPQSPNGRWAAARLRDLGGQE